jgi:hypothetical protein
MKKIVFGLIVFLAFGFVFLGCDNGTNGTNGTGAYEPDGSIIESASIYNCQYSEKTETRIDSNGNKSTHYLLSISYENALAAITGLKGSPNGAQYSLFWNSSISSRESWVILESNEFHYVPGDPFPDGVSVVQQIRLIQKDGGPPAGQRWNLSS